MDTLVIILVLAGVLILVGGLFLLLRKGKRKYEAQQNQARTTEEASKPQDPLKEQVIDAFDPRKLKVGGTVDYLQQMWTARGVVHLQDGSYTWNEFFLEATDGTQIHLSVEEDPDLQVIMWQEVRNSDLMPGKESISFAGHTYVHDEQGAATYTSEGTTNMPKASGNLEYVDYEGPDGLWLGFERIDGGRWEVSTGEEVNLSLFRMYNTNII